MTQSALRDIVGLSIKMSYYGIRMNEHQPLSRYWNTLLKFKVQKVGL